MGLRREEFQPGITFEAGFREGLPFSSLRREEITGDGDKVWVRVRWGGSDTVPPARVLPQICGLHTRMVLENWENLEEIRGMRRFVATVGSDFASGYVAVTAEEGAVG